MDWFLYDNGLRHERVKKVKGKNKDVTWTNFISYSKIFVDFVNKTVLKVIR